MGRFLRYFRMSLNPLRAFTIFATDPESAGTVTPVQLFSTSEVETEALWRDDRPIFRKVVSVGPMPDALSFKAVAHGIAVVFTLIRIRGVAFNPAAGGQHLSIPNADPNSVTLFVGDTNISIASAIDLTAYTTAYCILDYIKGQPI